MSIYDWVKLNVRDRFTVYSIISNHDQIYSWNVHILTFRDSRPCVQWSLKNEFIWVAITRVYWLLSIAGYSWQNYKPVQFRTIDSDWIRQTLFQGSLDIKDGTSVDQMPFKMAIKISRILAALEVSGAHILSWFFISYFITMYLIIKKQFIDIWSGYCFSIIRFSWWNLSSYSHDKLRD